MYPTVVWGSREVRGVLRMAVPAEVAKKPKTCTCFSLILLKGLWLPRVSPLGERVGNRHEVLRGEETSWAAAGRKASQSRCCWAGLQAVSKRAEPWLSGRSRGSSDHVSHSGQEAGVPVHIAVMTCQCTAGHQGLKDKDSLSGALFTHP